MEYFTAKEPPDLNTFLSMPRWPPFRLMWFVAFRFALRRYLYMAALRTHPPPNAPITTRRFLSMSLPSSIIFTLSTLVPIDCLQSNLRDDLLVQAGMEDSIFSDHYGYFKSLADDCLE
jgi:hypothetical protein